MGSKSTTADSEQVLIERERQKTKRQMMFYVLMGIIACFGLILVFRGTEGTRKVDIDLSKGKFNFSVDKPIVEQINQTKDSATLRGNKIEFTTGTVKSEVIDQIQQQNEIISPTRFTGKNLINKEAGFILTVEHPENYSVSYNPEGLHNSYIPVNTITGGYGNVNISRAASAAGYDFPTQVEWALQLLLNNGYLIQMPHINYDESRTTAFLTYNNQVTGGISYQKLTLKNGMIYSAMANYNSTLTPQNEKDDLVNMVASLTAIEN
jgi:hypothetical protein